MVEGRCVCVQQIFQALELGVGGGGLEVCSLNMRYSMSTWHMLKLSTEICYIPVDLPSKSSMTLRFCLVVGMVILKSLIL